MYTQYLSNQDSLYMCIVVYARRYINVCSRNMFFFLDKPEIQSISINNYKDQYREGSPISVTSIVKAFPAAHVTWGFQNPLETNTFMPLGESIQRDLNLLGNASVTKIRRKGFFLSRGILVLSSSSHPLSSEKKCDIYKTFKFSLCKDNIFFY